MGSWDGEVFGNDTAADWGGSLVDGDDPAAVAAALEEALAEEEYLDADIGSEALAAAEVVAAAGGHPGPRNSYSEAVLDWAARHPELRDLRYRAQQAVERVLAPESELRDLWLEDEEDRSSPVRGEWLGPVQDLQLRLAAA